MGAEDQRIKPRDLDLSLGRAQPQTRSGVWVAASEGCVQWSVLICVCVPPLKRICRYTLFQVEFLETVPRKNTMRDISKDFNWLIETFFSGELAVLVVLVVLVVSGVQHFWLRYLLHLKFFNERCNKRKRKRKRKKSRILERRTERERGRGIDT